MVGVKGFEPPTSCSQTSLIVPCSFQITTSCAFSVLFGDLLSTVSVWFSSVCGRRCGQKSPPIPSGKTMRIWEDSCLLNCSSGLSCCQVNLFFFQMTESVKCIRLHYFAVIICGLRKGIIQDKFTMHNQRVSLTISGHLDDSPDDIAIEQNKRITADCCSEFSDRQIGVVVI